jgi:hypothetical protein
VGDAGCASPPHNWQRNPGSCQVLASEPDDREANRREGYPGGSSPGPGRRNHN